jgi:hypothetical protein
MSRSKKIAPINEETAFLEYVESLRKHRSGRRAVHVRLSRLRAENRRRHHLQVAATTFELLSRQFETALFQLNNGDMIVICKDATVADIDRSILNLRYLFSEDPLLVHDEQGRASFCDWYDIEKDHEKLLKCARSLVRDRDKHDEAMLRDSDGPAQQHEQDSAPTAALDPVNLAAIQKIIAQADLSSMILSQTVCKITKGQKPEPIFVEFYTSISALRQIVSPDLDIRANRWLFQDLTRHLDRRMISHLAPGGNFDPSRPFSLNLNVATLLSPEFLAFDESLDPKFRKHLVVELQLVDIFADIGSFLFARDYFREHGYTFCLDGITHLSLPCIEHERLGFDLYKLFWGPDLRDQIWGVRGEELRHLARKIGAGRLILSRCDSELAIDLGASLGIILFQGQLIDDWLRRGVSRQDSIETLTDAMTRHRAATRS